MDNKIMKKEFLQSESENCLNQDRILEFHIKMQSEQAKKDKVLLKAFMRR